MMFLIRFWSNLTKKDSVESAKYEINKKKIMLVLTVLGCFFSSWIRIYFFGSDPDFRPLRIRTKKKEVRSGSGKKYPDPKHCCNFCSKILKPVVLPTAYQCLSESYKILIRVIGTKVHLQFRSRNHFL